MRTMLGTKKGNLLLVLALSLPHSAASSAVLLTNIVIHRQHQENDEAFCHWHPASLAIDLLL
jgi:hypothetical protein